MGAPLILRPCVRRAVRLNSLFERFLFIRRRMRIVLLLNCYVTISR